MYSVSIFFSGFGKKNGVGVAVLGVIVGVVVAAVIEYKPRTPKTTMIVANTATTQGPNTACFAKNPCG